MSRYIWFIVLTATLLLAGCGEKDENLEDSSAFMKLAELCLDKGNSDDAIEYLEKAVALEPGLAPAYLKLGLIHENVFSDTETANRYYALAVEYEKDPDMRSQIKRWLKGHKVRSSTPLHQTPFFSNESEVINAYHSGPTVDEEPKERQFRAADTALSREQFQQLTATVKLQKDTINNLQILHKHQEQEIARLKKRLEEGEQAAIELQNQIGELLRAEAAKPSTDELQKQLNLARQKNLALNRRYNKALTELDKCKEEIAHLKLLNQATLTDRTQVPSTTRYFNYTVKEGDSLMKIAAEFLGDRSKYDLIVNANADKIQNPNDIKIGMQLKIPKY